MMNHPHEPHVRSGGPLGRDTNSSVHMKVASKCHVHFDEPLSHAKRNGIFHKSYVPRHPGGDCYQYHKSTRTRTTSQITHKMFSFTYTFLLVSLAILTVTVDGMKDELSLDSDERKEKEGTQQVLDFIKRQLSPSGQTQHKDRVATDRRTSPKGAQRTEQPSYGGRSRSSARGRGPLDRKRQVMHVETAHSLNSATTTERSSPTNGERWRTRPRQSPDAVAPEPPSWRAGSTQRSEITRAAGRGSDTMSHLPLETLTASPSSTPRERTRAGDLNFSLRHDSNARRSPSPSPRSPRSLARRGRTSPRRAAPAARSPLPNGRRTPNPSALRQSGRKRSQSDGDLQKQSLPQILNDQKESTDLESNDDTKITGRQRGFVVTSAEQSGPCGSPKRDPSPRPGYWGCPSPTHTGKLEAVADPSSPRQMRYGSANSSNGLWSEEARARPGARNGRPRAYSANSSQGVAGEPPASGVRSQSPAWKPRPRPVRGHEAVEGGACPNPMESQRSMFAGGSAPWTPLSAHMNTYPARGRALHRSNQWEDGRMAYQSRRGPDTGTSPEVVTEYLPGPERVQIRYLKHIGEAAEDHGTLEQIRQEHLYQTTVQTVGGTVAKDSDEYLDLVKPLHSLHPSSDDKHNYGKKTKGALEQNVKRDNGSSLCDMTSCLGFEDLKSEILNSSTKGGKLRWQKVEGKLSKLHTFAKKCCQQRFLTKTILEIGDHMGVRNFVRTGDGVHTRGSRVDKAIARLYRRYKESRNWDTQSDGNDLNTLEGLVKRAFNHDIWRKATDVW